MNQRAATDDKPTSFDWALAASIALAGGALVLASVRRDPNALSFAAPMDGTVTTIVVASLLALAHGLRFRVVAALLAPILLVQIEAIRVAGFSLPPALGLELLIAGMLGVLASSRGRAVEGAVAKSAKLRPARRPIWSGAGRAIDERSLRGPLTRAETCTRPLVPNGTDGR